MQSKLANLTSKKSLITIGIILLVIAILGFTVWNTAFRVFPGPMDGPDVSDEMYFKYGSTNNEPNTGIPYWIWKVLPDVFPEYVPNTGSYAEFGFTWEEGQPTPMGLTKVDIGIVPRLGINCAICHISVYKEKENGKQTIVYGGVSQGIDVLAYQRFLFAVGRDPRFTADNILPKIEKLTKLSPLEEAMYRYVIIPVTQKAIREQDDGFSWTNYRPDWGPGRVDGINRPKFSFLKQPLDDTVGATDMMPLWNLKMREDMGISHWDGLNTSVTEMARSAAIGDGATGATFDVRIVDRIQHYLEGVPAPKYPFPIDANLAKAGAVIYDRKCAECHEAGKAQYATLIPIKDIGTDPERIKMWGQKDADAFNSVFQAYSWGFHHYRNLEGYVAGPLDGIWLRAPYLHNGSVPTLADLLKVPADRPKTFYRGYDVFDQENVGFLDNVPVDKSTGRVLWLFKITDRGNSNIGHLYGTELSDADKKALVEYMKTK